MRFLRKYANEFGYYINNEVADTLDLSRKKVPHLNNHKLQNLIRHFNIITNGKHRAYADSYATGRVYIECLRTKKHGADFDIKRYERVKPLFTQALDEFIKQDKTLKEFIKHILDTYNESIIPYLKAFHRDISTKALKPEVPSNEFQVPYKPQ